MRNKRVIFLVQAAVIAALYVVLTTISGMMGLASGVIQFRLSEALAILPYFTPAAIPGLFAGCFLANLLTGSMLWDVVLGSLATLIGALAAYYLRRCKWLVPLPNILANILIIPFVLRLVYQVPDKLGYLMITVGAGEVVTGGILGILLLLALSPHRARLFDTGDVKKALD